MKEPKITALGQGVRAHYWDDKGRYSSKTFMTPAEAHTWIKQCLNR